MKKRIERTPSKLRSYLETQRKKLAEEPEEPNEYTKEMIDCLNGLNLVGVCLVIGGLLILIYF